MPIMPPLNLSDRELFIIAWALRYAQHNVDDINDSYVDELAEGQEGKGIIHLSTEDESIDGVIPEESEVLSLADKIINFKGD